MPDLFPGILPYKPIREVVPGLWVVDGTLPNMPLNRNMFLWRTPGGGLVIHSGVAMNEADMAALEQLGTPTVMIVPNQGHRLDATWYKRRYPQLQVVCPRAARAKVEEVVTVDATCEEALASHGVRYHVPDGMEQGYELIYELDLPTGGKALVANDVLALPRAIPGFSGWIVGMLGAPGGKMGVPRIVRLRFGRDMKRFRAFVEGLAAIPDVRVLAFSHGDVFQGDASAALRDAATRI